MEWLILAIGGLSFFLSYLYGTYETVGRSLPVMPIEFLFVVVSISVVALLWKMIYPRFEIDDGVWKSKKGRAFLWFLFFGVVMVFVHAVAKHVDENIDMGTWPSEVVWLVENLHMGVSHTAIFFSSAVLLWLLSELEVQGSMRLMFPVRKRKILYLGSVLLGYSLFKTIVHYGAWGWQEYVYPFVALRIYRESRKNSLTIKDAVVVPLSLIILVMVAVLLFIESKIL